MLIEVGEKHDEFEKVIQMLGKIKNKNDKTSEIESAGIDCNKLLPKTHAFWTYDGSLTTPPLLESVTWIVFQTPIQVSEEQVWKPNVATKNPPIPFDFNHLFSDCCNESHELRNWRFWKNGQQLQTTLPPWW